MSTPASTVPKPPVGAGVPASATPASKEEEKKMETDDANDKKEAASASDAGVPVTAVAMKLLDVRLKPSSAILKSVLGEFTSEAVRSKRQQIVVARTGGVLELYGIHTGGSNTGSSGNSNNSNNNNNNW